MFKNVHYHREIRIPKTLSAKDNTDDKGKRALKVDELPALHKAAAKGSLAEINSLLDQGMDINAPLPFKVYLFNYNLDFNFKGSSPISMLETQMAPAFSFMQSVAKVQKKQFLPLLSHGAEIKE